MKTNRRLTLPAMCMALLLNILVPSARSADLQIASFESRFELPPEVASDVVPLRWLAASYGQVNAVRLLLAAGAKPDALHPGKKTTAMEVATARRDETLIALLKQIKSR